MTREQTTLYLDREITDLLQARGINISALVRKTLEDLAGVTSSDEMRRKAKHLRAEAAALDQRAIEIAADEKQLDKIKELYQKFRMEYGDYQNLQWLESIKIRYGFKDTPTADLLAVLKEET